MDYQPSDPKLAEILPKIRALSLEGKKEIYEYLRVTLGKGSPPVPSDPQVSSIGLFADEPELAEDISRESMEARRAVTDGSPPSEEPFQYDPNNPSLGLFYDEPEVVDEILRISKEAREVRNWRSIGG